MSYVAELHRESQERRRRLGAAAVPDRGIDLSKPYGVLGYAAKPRTVKVEPSKPEPTLEERLAEIRGKLIVTYANPDTSPLVCPPTIKDVQRVFCAVWDISHNDLISDHRMHHIVAPRHLCMMICRALTLRSTTEIGRLFGGKDHTSVIHACNKMRPVEHAVKARVPADATLLQWVTEAIAVYHAMPKDQLGRRYRTQI